MLEVSSFLDVRLAFIFKVKGFLIIFLLPILAQMEYLASNFCRQSKYDFSC